MSCLSLMYCIILTVRRHALIVHMLIKTLPARGGTYFGLYCTVAGCNENLTYIKKALIFSCRPVTDRQRTGSPYVYSELQLRWKIIAFPCSVRNKHNNLVVSVLCMVRNEAYMYMYASCCNLLIKCSRQLW